MTNFSFRNIFPVLAILWFLVWGCGKQTYEIGHEDPEVEIKKCIALSQKKLYTEAVECLEIFKSRFPQTQQGQEAELKIADNYFQQEQFLLAADSYQSFVKLHPANPNIDYAMYRTGLSYFREAPKAVDRDQQYLIKAVEQFRLTLQTLPTNTYREATQQALATAEERLAKRIYYIGRFYYRTHEYISSSLRFKELIEKFPHADLVPKTLYYLTESNLELVRLEEAREAVERLVTNYPKNRWTNKAQKHYLRVAQKKGP